MQKFTGKQYLCIAIANAMGFDKWNWDKRIDWVKQRVDMLEEYTAAAEDPYLFMKAVKALRDTQEGKPTGYIMSLDATASGPQIMACLTGCKQTAMNVNLIDTGHREDLYTKATSEMLNHAVETTRKEMKPVVMTVLYGSKAKPKELFGADTNELAEFYLMLYREVPGCMAFMDTVQSCWNPNALEHVWTLPDGHIAKVKVMGGEDKKIEIAELDKATFTQRCTVSMNDPEGLALPANLVQSLDGWVVREMLRRALKVNVQVACIHDSFWAHPNDMNVVRQTYNNILAELADTNYLEQVLREITGLKHLSFRKPFPNFGKEIRKANYALS